MAAVSTATTEGIRVNVSVGLCARAVVSARPPLRLRVHRSDRERRRDAAQLKSRHWVITDGDGRIEEVRGPGVVGQQPFLNPGDQFEYTSGCVLTTPRGEMRGSYQMHRPDGSSFEATIAPFTLSLPYSLN